MSKPRKAEFKFDDNSLRTFKASSEDAMANEHGDNLGTLEKLCDPFDNTQSRPQPEIAWLIERREPNPEWLYVVDWFSFGWTVDSLKAIRFARRQDAEQVLKMIETEVAFAVEHQWGMG